MHADTDDTSEATAPTDDHQLGNFDLDQFEDAIADRELEMPDGEVEPIEEVMDDITVAHEELNAYKQGALATCNALDNAIVKAHANGEDDFAEALTIIKEAAFGVYLRVKRGDDELFGDRDGRYDDYFENL